jgi:hypothetical protein
MNINIVIVHRFNVYRYRFSVLGFRGSEVQRFRGSKFKGR